MKQNILTRFYTSLIIFAVFMMIFLTSFLSPLFEIAISFLSMFCIWEAIRGTGYAEKQIFMIPSLIFGGLLPLIFAFKPYILPNRSAWYGVIILGFLYCISSFILMMCNIQTLKFNNTAAIMFMSFLIPSFLSTLVYIRRLSDHGFFYMVLAIVCCAWVTDIFAYLVGMMFGKHHFVPHISPKKTIEGSLGGAVFCIGFFALFCLIYQWIYHVSFRWDLVFLYAFVCTVVGQLGDLSFSLIKRSYGIKDFGRILPGHGGILDRLDSLIFIAPTFYLLLSIQPLVR